MDIFKPAGSLGNDGYVHIMINYKGYQRSRLIFFMFNGFWPEEVDHIDRVKNNDRKENLREATKSLNGKNRAGYSNTGIKYISKIKSKTYKAGFYYEFSINRKFIKKSAFLDVLLSFRNKWLAKNRPDLWELCKRFND